MNSNTFKCFSSQYASGHPFVLPAAFTTTSATETAFLLSTGAVAAISIPTGAEIMGSSSPLSPNANASELGHQNRWGRFLEGEAPFFNSSSFDGNAFKLHSAGYVRGGGTTLTSVSATIALYLGAVSTLGSDTKIAAPAAFNIGNVKANWSIDAVMLWDSTSGVLQGQYGMMVNGAQVATTVITSQTTIALASLSFVLSWIFATTSTSNTIGLTELSLERV